MMKKVHFIPHLYGKTHKRGESFGFIRNGHNRTEEKIEGF